MRPLALLVAMIAIACSATAAADTTADEIALRKLKEVSWPKAYQSTNVLIKRDGQWRAIASHVSGYKKIQ